MNKYVFIIIVIPKTGSAQQPAMASSKAEKRKISEKTKTTHVHKFLPNWAVNMFLPQCKTIFICTISSLFQQWVTNTKTFTNIFIYLLNLSGKTLCKTQGGWQTATRHTAFLKLQLWGPCLSDISAYMEIGKKDNNQINS